MKKRKENPFCDARKGLSYQRKQFEKTIKGLKKDLKNKELEDSWPKLEEQLAEAEENLKNIK